jgi:hypothetical protein
MTDEKDEQQQKRERPKRKVASRSFVDRMTSAEAEPDALDRERDEARRREEAGRRDEAEDPETNRGGGKP